MLFQLVYDYQWLQELQVGDVNDDVHRTKHIYCNQTLHLMVIHDFTYPGILLQQMFKMSAFSFDMHSYQSHNRTRHTIKNVCVCGCTDNVMDYVFWCAHLAFINKIFHVPLYMQVKEAEIEQSVANSADPHGQFIDQESTDSEILQQVN